MCIRRVSQYSITFEKAATILLQSECFLNNTNGCPKMSTAQLPQVEKPGVLGRKTMLAETGVFGEPLAKDVAIVSSNEG